MLVQFNGTWLTTDGTQDERAISSVIDAKLNGKQVVQDAQFLRGVATIPISRGNESNVFSFKVSRNFKLLMPEASNPVAQAAAFMLTHFSNLPKEGVLLIVCGGIGEDPIDVTAANAVLEGLPECSFTGVGVDITYTIKCDVLTMIDPPPNGAFDAGAYGDNYIFPDVTNLDGAGYTDPDPGRILVDCGAY